MCVWAGYKVSKRMNKRICERIYLRRSVRLNPNPMQGIFGPKVPEDDPSVEATGGHDCVGNLDEHARNRLGMTALALYFCG